MLVTSFSTCFTTDLEYLSYLPRLLCASVVSASCRVILVLDVVIHQPCHVSLHIITRTTFTTWVRETTLDNFFLLKNP